MRRFGFALLACAVSTFFAECTIGNFSPVREPLSAILMCLPLYGLHLLVLSRVAWAKGKPSFATLYLCGVLFGLYETYITKIVWTGWDGKPVPIFGVSSVAVLTVVLWWHPFAAFIMPQLFIQRYVTGYHDGEGLMPRRVQAILDDPRRKVRLFVLLGVFLGLYQASVAMKKPEAPLFSLFDALALLAAVAIWRRREGDRLSDLLPSGRGLVVAGVLLAAVYAVFTPILNPQSLPGIAGQATVWYLYALFILLVGLSYRGSKRVDADAQWHAPAAILREWPIFLVTWHIVSWLPRLVPYGPQVGFVICTLLGVGVGLVSLVRSIAAAVRVHPQSTLPRAQPTL